MSEVYPVQNTVKNNKKIWFTCYCSGWKTKSSPPIQFLVRTFQAKFPVISNVFSKTKKPNVDITMDDRWQVELWSTINEPRMTAMGYGTYLPGFPTDGGTGCPPSLGTYHSGISDYMTWRNLLLAHAAVYKAFKKTGLKGEECDVETYDEVKMFTVPRV